jgi:hypothetical protein
MPASANDVPVMVEDGGQYSMEVGYAVYGEWKEVYHHTDLMNVVAWLENVPEFVP